ncbi:MAG: hypothetical protein AAF591_20190, partial [Verrucomicrobiota bacterium]
MDTIAMRTNSQFRFMKLGVFVCVLLCSIEWAVAGLTTHRFGDIEFVLGDGWVRLNVYAGPCEGEYKQRFTGAGIYCFCDDTICVEVGPSEEFIGLPVLAWPGRLIEADIRAANYPVADDSGEVVCLGTSVPIHLGMSFGAGTAEISDNLLSFLEGVDDNFIEYMDLDAIRFKYYVINVSDLQGVNYFADSVLNYAIDVTDSVTISKPLEAFRQSPLQVPCPMFDAHMTVEHTFPVEGTYLFVVEIDASDAFLIDYNGLLDLFDGSNVALELWDPANDRNGVDVIPQDKMLAVRPIRVVAENCADFVADTDGWLPWEDSDADLLPDEWEDFYYAGLDYGTREDADVDGLGNLYEMYHGTIPINPALARLVVNSKYSDLYYSKM